MSRAEFIAYYETRHAPLIRSLLPDIADYRRNFVDREGAIESSVAAIDFDSVTEIYFADCAAYERFWERSADPEVARAIAEDEENVFDRAATRLFIVDETGEPDRSARRWPTWRPTVRSARGWPALRAYSTARSGTRWAMCSPPT